VKGTACVSTGSTGLGIGIGKRVDWTIHDWVDWVQAYLDDEWMVVWEVQLAKLTRIYEREGEAAYGLYSRRLFVPVRDALAEAGVTCRPALPGTFELSEERWGYLACRERRLWSVLRRPESDPLGAIVTRFFHDHTRLRVPKAPVVFAVEGRDLRAIRHHALAGSGPLR
jgi:hypothetical protein